MIGPGQAGCHNTPTLGGFTAQTPALRPDVAKAGRKIAATEVRMPGV